MPLNAAAILGLELPEVEQSITDRDAMLYALSLGLSADPLDQAELAYTFERNLVVAPTLPVVIGHPGPWMADPALAITRNKIVHGSQQLRNLRPLPIDRPIIGRNKVTKLVDKGEKGGLIVMSRELVDKAEGTLLATMESIIFARADGGFGGDSGGAPQFVPTPTRAADAEIDVPTRPDAALLYRLNGDRNPLHADPAFAERAGFPKPILHGLCTYGLAGVGILRSFGASTPILSIEARFAKPVFPGETVRFRFWHEEGRLLFEASVVERGVVVLDGGVAEIG